MKHFARAACILGLLLVFAEGCATIAAPITTPDVTAKLVPDRDLAQHGVSFTADPFLAPATLLMPQDEFVTMTITLALPLAAHVTISGGVEDGTGKSIARLYSKQELHDYWLARGRAQDPDMVKRLSYLDTFYVPSLAFAGFRGRHEYYVVMVGKRPLPRPATVILAVSLGVGDPKQFAFELPPFKP